MSNNAKQRVGRIQQRRNANAPYQANSADEGRLRKLIEKDERAPADSPAIASGILTPSEIEELRQEMREADALFQEAFANTSPTRP